VKGAHKRILTATSERLLSPTKGLADNASQVGRYVEPVSGEEAISYGSPRGRWVIAACVLGSGIASLDATVVGIALPAIGRTFGVGVGTLQWVVTGYTLTLAAFLLLGGSLGDRLGRRRVFLVGVVWFAVASVGCGVAPTASLLIAARLLQGVGGALLTPASLAILESSFRVEDRSRAIGAWSGLGGLATAGGPLLGGYLISAVSWRWVFFINLPVAVVVILLTVRHVPESSDPTIEGPVDVAGAGLAVVLLAGLTYGLIEGPGAGWSSPAVVASLAVAGVAIPLFLLLERSRRNPMLPLDLFGERQFGAANGVTFIVYGALAGALFLLPVELQVVDHYSALQAGMSLLPVTAIMLVFSARSARLASRIGPRLQMSVGPVVVGIGLVLLTRTTHGTHYLTFVFPAVVVFGAGLAVTVAPLTATAMGAAPAERAGVASAVNNVVARSAGLLSVAVLPVVAGISGSLTSAPFASGFRTAMLVAGSACGAGGVVAAGVIRNPPHRPTRRPTLHCQIDGTPLRPVDGIGTRPR
jgi:EmrB/QacA subfamily drug resistance transporter